MNGFWNQPLILGALVFGMLAILVGAYYWAANLWYDLLGDVPDGDSCDG